MEKAIDFKKVFESAPGCYLLLACDETFTIMGVSDAYLRATMTMRDIIVGKGLFDVFPDNPDDPKADGVANLTASLKRVIARKISDKMAVQKYDIPLPKPSDGFEKRYWSPENFPVLDNNGNMYLIIHCVVDVTRSVELEEWNKTMEERIAQSNETIEQLEKLNKFMVGREILMAELKKENEVLKEKIGENL